MDTASTSLLWSIIEDHILVCYNRYPLRKEKHMTRMWKKVIYISISSIPSLLTFCLVVKIVLIAIVWKGKNIHHFAGCQIFVEFEHVLRSERQNRNWSWNSGVSEGLKCLRCIQEIQIIGMLESRVYSRYRNKTGTLLGFVVCSVFVFWIWTTFGSEILLARSPFTQHDIGAKRSRNLAEFGENVNGKRWLRVSFGAKCCPL